MVHLNKLNLSTNRTQLSPFMKIKKLIFLVLAFIFSAGCALAQGGPPPPPDPVDDITLPIDEQLWVGIILAILLGVYFIYSRRTSSQK
jgi:hypothetical protein